MKMKHRLGARRLDANGAAETREVCEAHRVRLAHSLDVDAEDDDANPEAAACRAVLDEHELVHVRVGHHAAAHEELGRAQLHLTHEHFHHQLVAREAQRYIARRAIFRIPYITL